MSPRIGNRIGMAVAVGLTLFVGMGQAPKPEPPKQPAAREVLPVAQDLDKPRPEEAAIKPLPLEPIPDNPPPHEGALFRIAHRIEAPDLILIEALEALPGRPITGEHLVLTDGSVCLGFYGNVNIAGLTTKQAKVKIALHLRRFLTDIALGLNNVQGTGDGQLAPLEPPGTVVEDIPPAQEAVDPELVVTKMRLQEAEKRLDEARDRKLKALALLEALQKELGETKEAADVPAKPEKDEANEEPNPFRQPKRPKSPSPPKDGVTPPVKQAEVALKEAPGPKAGPNEPVAAQEDLPLDRPMKIVAIAPQNSPRVYVDVAAFNTSVYYVLGDVGAPGRLPIIGSETVLDAIQFAGGLQHSADPKKLVLYRPERGGKLAKEYKIDLAAIYRGDKKANLQLFPGDRLIAGRKDEYLKAEPAAKK